MPKILVVRLRIIIKNKRVYFVLLSIFRNFDFKKTSLLNY